MPAYRGWFGISFGLALGMIGSLTVACEDDSNSGDSIECQDLCARAPMTGPLEGACVDEGFNDRGYDTDTDACDELSALFVSGNATAEACQACSRSIGAGATDCAEVEDSCF